MPVLILTTPESCDAWLTGTVEEACRCRRLITVPIPFLRNKMKNSLIDSDRPPREHNKNIIISGRGGP